VNLREYLYKSGFDMNVIDTQKQQEFLKIYNRIFNLKQPPTQCGSCWVKIINKLKTVFEEYKNQA
jgi:hypothetical protein